VAFENGKLLRVVLKAEWSGNVQVNTIHYDLVDNISLGADNDPQTLADLFRDNVMPKIAQLYNSSWTIGPVEVVEEKDPLNPTRPRSAWTSGSPLAGTRTESSDYLPNQMCILYRLDTATIGRRFNGRLFSLGQMHESDWSTGGWNSAALTFFKQYVDAIPHQPDLVTGPSDNVANWVVYSRTQRQANLTPYTAHVNSAIQRSSPHWLRSRA
jgi:hypothetical protein